MTSYITDNLVTSMNDPQTENYFFNKFIVIPFPFL